MRSILVGVVIGAGAAFMCAPVSGGKARSVMRNGLNRLSRYAKDFIHDRRVHLRRALIEYEPRKRYYESLDESTMEAVAGR